MKQRTRADLLRLRVKNIKQEDNLKNKQLLYDGEVDRYRKTTAGKVRSKNVLNGLMKVRRANRVEYRRGAKVTEK